MTVTIFAKKVGVTRWTVHYWKNGRNIPTPEHMAKIRTLTEGKVSKEDELKDDI